MRKIETVKTTAKLVNADRIADDAGVSLSALCIAVRLGLISGVASKYGCRVYESERENVTRLRDLLAEDNIIYGHSQLGEYLQKLGGKKAWGKEYGQRLLQTRAFLGFVDTSVHRKRLSVPVYSKKDIASDHPTIFILRKRMAYEKNRRRGTTTGTLTSRQMVHEAVREVNATIARDLALFRSYHPFLETAFYLYHANHYAKTPGYEQYADYLYNLKRQILLYAYHSCKEVLSVSFITGSHRIIFCPACKQSAIEKWRIFGQRGNGKSWFDYADPPCPSCDVQKEYYSLVEFRISTPVVNYIFHVPYPIIKDVVNCRDMVRAKKSRQEGMVDSCGSRAEKYEPMIVPLKKVIHELETYLGTGFGKLPGQKRRSGDLDKK